MTLNEIAWFAGLILFGSIVGIVAGGIAAKKAKGMETAIMGAILPGMVLPLSLCFIAGVFEAHQPSGFSITNALLAGIGVLFFYGIGVAVFIAPALLLSSIASYAVFTKCMRKFKEPNTSRHGAPRQPPCQHRHP